MNNKQLLMILILTLAMSVALVACSNDDAIDRTDDTESVEKASTERAEAITCPHCEAEIDRDDKFCSDCGKAIKGDEAAEPSKTTVLADETEQTEETTELAVETTADEDVDAAAEYRNASFLEGVANFVVDSDLSNVEYFNQLDYSVVESEADPYTGEVRTYHFSEQIPQGMMLRVPQLTEDSALAKRLNEEMATLAFEALETEYLYYLKVDYDAYIYDDVLSISLKQDLFYEGSEVGSDRIVKTYHFDISGGQLKPLTSGEMLARLNASSELLTDFAYDYIPQAIDDFVGGEMWNYIDDDIAAAVKTLQYGLDNDDLILYKNVENDYYSLEIDYDFMDDYGVARRVSFTVAADDFKMALLSKPEGAIGVIYKAFKERELPAKSLYNQPLKLTALNEKSEGMPVYIAAFSERAELIDIADLELIEVGIDTGNPRFAKKAMSKGFDIVDQPGVADVYLYYTMLPEVMPFEAVHMTGVDWGSYDVTADCDIYDDMRFGSPMQYIYGTVAVDTYKMQYGDDQFAALTLNLDGTFTASDSDGNWAEAGVPITGGRYTSDRDYVYLFPCEDDVARGAGEVYVYGKDPYVDDLSPLSTSEYGSYDGEWLFEREYN